MASVLIIIQQCQSLKEAMMSNILISSAGRRVELLESFKTELKKHDKNLKVIASDLEPLLSPACQIADEYFSICKVTDAEFINQLLKICIEREIKVVVPTIDTELMILAENRKKFEEYGINIVISHFDLIKNCQDKRLTKDVFENINVPYPKIFDKAELEFPCFCKPYDGSSSVGTQPVHTQLDLTEDLIDNPKNIFMELVPNSYIEYTIDGYYTTSGKLVSLVPRERLEIRAGEVSKGITRKNFVYDYLVKRINTFSGARGCITFQIFVNHEQQDIKGLEINPRFGGGYPLSYYAGANFPKYIIDEYLLGKKLEFYDGWDNNLLMLRYDSQILVKNYEK